MVFAAGGYPLSYIHVTPRISSLLQPSSSQHRVDGGSEVSLLKVPMLPSWKRPDTLLSSPLGQVPLNTAVQTLYSWRPRCVFFFSESECGSRWKPLSPLTTLSSAAYCFRAPLPGSYDLNPGRCFWTEEVRRAKTVVKFHRTNASVGV